MERIDRHADLLVFVRIAEHGGFGKAAHALGISTSQASRALSRLEERLGTRLVNRTTRRMALTEAGRALFDRARSLIEDLDAAEQSVTERAGEVRGTLRASLPVVFGLRYIAPAAAEFASRHPHLSMELSFEDRRVDLVQEGFDVAVRISAMTDSSLIARKLGATRGRLVASPAYLASRGAPQHPRDLAAYDVLLYTLGSDPVWTFLRGTDEVHVRVRGRFAANNGDALRHAALCGLGFTRAPDFVVDEDIAAGRLVPVLPEWDASLPIYAVWPAGRHLSMRVRAFVDFLASRKCPGDGR